MAIETRWQFDKLNALTGFIALLSIAYFCYSVVDAISKYEGTYRISQDFLSDLGRTDTAASAEVFNPAVIALGCGLLPFFIVVPRALNRGKSIIRAAATVSCIGLGGIGLTPYDAYFVAHHIFLVTWVGPMVCLVVAFAIGSIRDGIAPMGTMVGSCVLVALIAFYAVAGSHSGYVVFQKAVACMAIVWMIIVVSTTTLFVVHAVVPSSHIQRIEKQARDYAKVIEKKHRR